MNLHHLIIKSFVERGFPPTPADLAAEAGLSPAAAASELRALADSHGVVFHPHCPEVWICHPFATYPMGWWVEKGTRGWFTNCAWCALGVCALVGGESRVHTLIGGEAKKVSFAVGASGPTGGDTVVHFAVPPKRAWENVLFTCGTITLFEREHDVDPWCRRYRLPKGEVVPLLRAWQLACAWYGNHLAEDWKKWTIAEAAAIFQRVGLGSDFWKLDAPDGAGRF